MKIKVKNQKKNLNNEGIKMFKFRSVLTLVILLVVMLGAMAAGFVYKQIVGEPIVDVQKVEEFFNIDEGEKFVRTLDGVFVKHEEEVQPVVTAIMIDNHPEARPSIGLAQASVVYEVPVEGRFTRFLALYALPVEIFGEDFEENKNPTSTPVVVVTSTSYTGSIGPVRSARPYFLDIAGEYNAIYTHVGGSPVALSQVRSGNINNLNEFFKGHLFWRAQNRWAPHNVLTTLEKIEKGRLQYFDDLEKSNFESWKWVDEKKSEIKDCEICLPFISIDWKDKSNYILWEFDFENKKYDRFRDGELHTDVGGAGIYADTIVVQYVKSHVIDNVGRLDIDIVGEGEVEIYHGGNDPAKGIWKKDGRYERTKFFVADENGEADEDREIYLRRGKVWVEVVPEGVKVDGFFSKDGEE